MTVLEEMQGAAFQIIAHAGEARSHYVEAIRLARADDFEKAQQLIEKGGSVSKHPQPASVADSKRSGR